MSAVAARCPHCGTVQSRAASVVSASRSARPLDAAPPVLKEVSTAEARAILAIAAVRDGRIDGSDDEPGLFAALLLPHPRSAGLARVDDVVWGLIGVCWVALLARAGVRAFVRGRRRPADLTR